MNTSGHSVLNRKSDSAWIVHVSVNSGLHVKMWARFTKKEKDGILHFRKYNSFCTDEGIRNSDDALKAFIYIRTRWNNCPSVSINLILVECRHENSCKFMQSQLTENRTNLTLIPWLTPYILYQIRGNACWQTPANFFQTSIIKQFLQLLNLIWCDQQIKVSITRRTCISVPHDGIAPQVDKQCMIIFKNSKQNVENPVYLCIRRSKSNKHTDPSFPISVWQN